MTTRQTTADSAESIIYAVAEYEDIDPMKLSPPLATVVDPDALDRVLGTAPTDERQGVTAQFTYRGHEVVVSSDGRVTVR